MNIFLSLRQRYTDDRNVFLLLILSFSGIILGFLDIYIFGSLPGAREPKIDRYLLISLPGAILFLLTILLPLVRKHAVIFITLYAALVMTDVGFIVAYNNTRIEYMLGYLVGNMFMIMLIRLSKHLKYYIMYISVIYVLSCIILFFWGFSQQILSVIWMAVMSCMFYYWGMVRINVNEKIERTVIERTKSLREEQAKLRASIDAMDEAYIIVNPEQQIVLKNSSVTTMFHVDDSATFEHIAGQLSPSFNLQEKVQTVLRERKRMTLGNISWNEKFIHIFLAPITDTVDNSQLLGILIVIQDETESRVLERAKDEFFTIASHELRTPLTIIKGSTSIILDSFQESTKEPTVQQLLQSIFLSSDKLIKMVNEFLDLSRLEQHKIEYLPTNIPVNTVISETHAELENEMQKKDINFMFNPENELYVFADRQRFKQILMNLLSNSIKFAQKGTITVKVIPHEETCEIQITDSGQGIPPEMQSLLFRKFQQAGKSIYARDVSGGTGLGLYISKRFVEDMKGTIRLVSSEPGKGTVFAFTLPLATE